MRKVFITTIAGSSYLIEGSERAALVLPNGTPLQIKNALYSLKSMMNLLSFKDIRLNGYHLEMVDKKGEKYLYITQVVSCQKCVFENFLCISSGLYFTRIKVMESDTVLTRKINDPEICKIWHERLGHPGATMMRGIITSSYGHPLKDYKILIINMHV